MSGPVGADLTGLELWVINGDGTGDRRVLVGTPGNGFGPDLFYGDRPVAAALHGRLPAAALQRRRRRRPACRRPRQRRGPAADRPARPPPPTADAAAVARPPPPPTPASPAAVKPFAQTDPRWGDDLMRTEGTRHPLVGLRADQHGDGLQLLRRRHRPRPPQQCAGDQADELHWDPVRAALRRRQDPRRRPAGAARRPGPTWRRRWPTAGRSIVGLAGRAGRLALPGRHRRPRRPGRQLQDRRQLGRLDLQDAGRLHQPEEGLHPQVADRLRGRPPPCTPDTGPPEPGRRSPSPARATPASTTRRSRCATRSTRRGRAARSRAAIPDGATIADEGPHTVTVTVSAGRPDRRASGSAS